MRALEKDGSIEALVREGLEGARDYVPKLKAGLEGIAASLEMGDRAGALERFSLAVKGIGWLIDMYDRCREFAAVPIRPQEEAALRTKLLGAMRRVVAEAEVGDDASAARSIRGELLGCVETLGSRVDALTIPRLQ